SPPPQPRSPPRPPGTGRHSDSRAWKGAARSAAKRPYRSGSQVSTDRNSITAGHIAGPTCGKIPVTGSGPTRQREPGIRLADQQVIGKVGRVTGTIGPERVGEVMIPIRGGSEAFNAHARDTKATT